MSKKFGITESGFVRKTSEDILSELQADQRATMYDDLDVSEGSVVGKQNATVTKQLAEGWSALEGLYNAGDVDAASYRALENMCKLIGVYRGGETKSVVTLSCNLIAGTTLTPSQQFAANKDQPDIRWTPVVPYRAEMSGAQPVLFEAENGGPIEAPSDTITVIATPIVGWNSVSQPEDAIPGEVVQDDTAMRRRRNRELALMGSTTVRAIKAKLSDLFPAPFASLEVYENDTDYVDSEGRLPHSVEVLIFDEGGVADNDKIAQTIADSLSGGIQTFGNTSGTAKVLEGNDTVDKTIKFSRAVARNVYLEFDLEKAAKGYPLEVALKTYIAAHANEQHAPGDDVAWSFLSASTFALGGVFKCSQVRLGFLPSPTAHEVDLPIGFREIARFDTSRIIINAI